jgi:hypothetical protein
MYNTGNELKHKRAGGKQMKIMFLGSLLAAKWLTVTAKYRTDLILPVLTA